MALVGVDIVAGAVAAPAVADSRMRPAAGSSCTATGRRPEAEQEQHSCIVVVVVGRTRTLAAVVAAVELESRRRHSWAAVHKRRRRTGCTGRPVAGRSSRIVDAAAAAEERSRCMACSRLVDFVSVASKYFPFCRIKALRNFFFFLFVVVVVVK